MYTAKWVGLDEFQGALSRSSRELPQQTEISAHAAGEAVLVPVIARSVPRRSGRLARGYGIRSRGKTHEVVGEAYAAGAEWGKRGKWSGFRGHYAGDALDQVLDPLAEMIFDGIKSPLFAFGWFR